LSDAKGYQADADSGAYQESWLRRWRWPLILGGPLLILGLAAYFILTGGRTEATDDAYVDIAKAPVAASVPGRVVAVYVRENQVVKAGQPLFKLDSRDYQVGAAQAEANLAQAELQVRALRAAYGREQANLSSAQATAAYAAREAARQKALVAAGVSSQAQAAEAANTARQAADAVTA